MPVRATRRVHPSASRADPPQKSFTSSVSLVGGGGAAKKQRRALSDASNNVDNASKSRPNRNNGRKNAPVMMESTLCSLSRDDPVQPPPVVANERKDVLYAIEKRAKKVLDALLDELDGDFAKRIEEIREHVLVAEKKVAKQFTQHSKKLSKITRSKRAADVKGYEESAFVAARKEVAESIFRREEEEGADGDEMRGKKKRKTSSSREGGSGGGEKEEERAGDAPAPAPPLVDAVAETAATSVEETTVIETMVGEENKGKSEEEEVEEFYEPALVLKTDSGTEVDLTKLRSSKDVAPEMGGYLKKLQQQLSILLGGGNRTSD